jgi:peptidylprolyl isomerase
MDDPMKLYAKAPGRILSILLLLVAFAAGVRAQDSTSTSTEESIVPQEGTRVRLETSLGAITLRLYDNLAPKAVENFVGLAKKGYYDGVTFHRVIPGFMMQGGDPTGTGMGGRSIWGKPFEDEISDSLQFDRRGILAMANGGPSTNGSQFFITFAPTAWLNGHHTIFGEVIDGWDVLDAAEKVEIGPKDKPVKDITITGVKVLEDANQE